MIKLLNNMKFVLKSNAPKIMFGAGIVGVLGGTVFACKATLQLPGIIDDLEADLIEANKKDSSDAAVTKAYTKAVVKTSKIYAPAVLLSSAGVGLLSGSHISLSRRNTALASAYTASMSAYDKYRGTVKEKLGEEEENQIYYSVLNDLDADPINFVYHAPGTEGPFYHSPYARFFDHGCPDWQKNASYNEVFLLANQNWLNHLLQSRGYVFLNEAYDRIGLPYSEAGQVIGWSTRLNPDSYVDFGMEDVVSKEFLDPSEPIILLDFNVDGVILGNGSINRK